MLLCQAVSGWGVDGEAPSEAFSPLLLLSLCPQQKQVAQGVRRLMFPDLGGWMCARMPHPCRDTSGCDSPVVPGLPLCRAAALERVASADKVRIKEVILSQAGTGAVLRAGMQINSQNSKLVFFNEPEKTFFPPLSLAPAV